MTSPVQHYGRFAVAMHWLAAGCIILGVVFGLSMDEDDTQSLTLMIHKSIGLTIFVLACLRLAWRIFHRPPPMPEMPAWQRVSARITHGLLYFVIFFLPITGYVAVAARGRGTSFFGLFDIPLLTPLSRALSLQSTTLHVSGQILLYALLAAHVGAAGYHHFILKDGLFSRMWPQRR